MGTNKLNELRVQYARRHQFRTQGISVEGPAVTVSGVAQFGGARLGDGNSVGFDFNQGITQVIDNLSWIRSTHAYKMGIDAQWIGDRRVRGEQFVYTFPNNAAYLAAKRRRAKSATLAAAAFGNLHREIQLGFYGLFVQDDWQVLPHSSCCTACATTCSTCRQRVLRGQPVLAGLHRSTRTTRAARGVSWSVDAERGPVVRASLGLMYEPPLIDFYDNAILSNGDPASYNVTHRGRSRARRRSRRASPTGRRGSCCRGRASPRWIRTSGPQSAWLSNVQVERALNDDCRCAGYVNSVGRNMPVLIDVNIIRPGGRCADWPTSIRRPSTRDPRRPDVRITVNVFKSIGECELQRVHADAGAPHARGWQRQARIRWRAGPTTRRRPARMSLAAVTIASRTRPISIARKVSRRSTRPHVVVSGFWRRRWRATECARRS
jgi:hypothetical protein